MTTDLRHSEYLTLAEEITKLQRKRLSLRRNQRNIQHRMNSIRAKLLLEVGTTKDEKGRLLYSNEHLRDAALSVKLDEHAEYCALRESRNGLDDEISENGIEYDKLLDHKVMLMVELGIVAQPERDQNPDVQ